MKYGLGHCGWNGHGSEGMQGIAWLGYGNHMQGVCSASKKGRLLRSCDFRTRHSTKPLSEKRREMLLLVPPAKGKQPKMAHGHIE